LRGEFFFDQLLVAEFARQRDLQATSQIPSFPG
jgi:hypothetical protein